jgi:hypothetical protein
MLLQLLLVLLAVSLDLFSLGLLLRLLLQFLKLLSFCEILLIDHKLCL